MSETQTNKLKIDTNDMISHLLKWLKKNRRWVIIGIIILVICSPAFWRAFLGFGTWREVNNNTDRTWVSEGKTKFHSNGVWMETFGDGSGSDGEWELLSDYTLIFDNGYNTTYYNFGEWYCIGTHLFLGDDYTFTRLPFLYSKD